MLGAALEGVLLVTAAKTEPGLRERGLWPSGDPLRWDLHTLIGLGIAAGWFDADEFNTEELSLSDVVDAVRRLRNGLHPGVLVRGREATVDEDVCRATFLILEAVFVVSARAVREAPEVTNET